MVLASFFRTATGATVQPSSGSHVTDAPEIERDEIGLAVQHLEREMISMYWAGVARELPHILLTLRTWQMQPEFANTPLPDEKCTFIHGYDTFLDQVSHSSREFADRNDEAIRRSGRNPEAGIDSAPTRNTEAANTLPTYAEALEDRGWDVLNDIQSSEIKVQIRDALGYEDEMHPEEELSLRRARLLLQSSQFLDIDKMIEYREPEKMIGFWKRPAPPQLVQKPADKNQMPVFEARVCVECEKIVRGATFLHVQDDTIAVCESCYRLRHFGSHDFTKRYKESCLHRDFPPDVSRKICHCPSVQRRDNTGAPRTLWPIDVEKEAPKHLQGGNGKLRCGLYDLPDLVAEAKYAGTRTKMDKAVTLDGELKKAIRAAKRFDLWDAKYDTKEKERPPRTGLTRFVNTAQSSVAEYGKSYGYTEKSPEFIPVYLRPIANKYPYGNVHMALRIGSLVIENGVAHTHGGVLITSRDPPNLQVLRDEDAEIEDSLLLCGKDDRKVYSQRRPRQPKRYKAMMKQVVGGAFSGLFTEHLENEIVESTLRESQLLIKCETAMEEASHLKSATQRLLRKLKEYLGMRIEAYIASVAGRLVDPEVDLHWTFHSNNCQTFCDSLIDKNMFGPLFAMDRPADYATKRPLPDPLYLMSFVCRPGAYIKARARSKFDVPNGLTEEYLLKFRYGRHDESDIIDSLSEYWYDWGAFESGIYPYQDVFPWDCTEAFNRYPVRCSDCNVAKHVWAFPFDSWSLISLHLARGRQLYPREGFAPGSDLNPGGEGGKPATSGVKKSGLMSDEGWFRNRLTVLLGQDALLRGAVAMSRCGSFRESTLWLSAQDDDTQDRLKLGGIHRAQPFSHHFERGAFHQYFVAEWSHLTRPQRIKAYEALRDWKATRKDVGDNRSDDGGGSGGCGGFVCGAFAAGCAAGCSSGQDSCGSGCVSSCGSGGDGDGCGSGCGGCGGG